MENAFTISPLGDSAVLAKLGETVSESDHGRVQAFAHYIDSHPFEGYIECVPSFTTVSVFYNLLELHLPSMEISGFDYVSSILNQYMADVSVKQDPKQVIIDIPVCYGGAYGPDLEYVASVNGMTAEEVIQIHTAENYLVYAIGFAPGFPYLAGVSERIATPRKQTPRLRIPAGSVGIAGSQTGIYPIETPGGWQIIGRTPRELFKPHQDPPTLLKGGEYIQFREIEASEYDLLRGGSA